MNYPLNVKWVVGIVGRQYVFVQYIWGWNKNRKYKITKKCKIITKKYKIQKRGVKLDNNNLSRDVEKIKVFKGSANFVELDSSKLSELDQVHLACRTQRWKGRREWRGRWETVINYEESDEKSALVWSGHEDVIYTGINAQNMYIKYKYKIYTRFI